MAFDYAPAAGQYGQGLNYGQAMQNSQALNIGQHYQPQQSIQQTIDPIKLAQIYKQYHGGGSQPGEGLSSLFGSSAITQDSSPEIGGNNFSLGGSLIGGSGDIGGSSFAPESGVNQSNGAGSTMNLDGMWSTLASIIMGKK